MNANPTLQQKKYARVIACFAKKAGVSLSGAMDMFYRSQLHHLTRDGVSDLRCMSDNYLVGELAAKTEEPSLAAAAAGLSPCSMSPTPSRTIAPLCQP